MLPLLFLICVVSAALPESFYRPGKTAKELFSDEQIKKRLGTDEKAINLLPRHDRQRPADWVPPESFDTRTAFPHCMRPVRDQGSCGSCWSFGSASSLSDRVCINGLIDHGIDLSMQWAVNCDKGNLGCYGGILANTWSHLAIFGIPEDSCLPYTATMFECPTTCQDGSEPTLYYSQGAEYFPPSDLEEVMYELMTNGPLETAFSVYTDFYEGYKGGVYEYKYGKWEGGHAVKLVGWGHEKETGKDYWIMQNSWGPEWGEEGFFRIIRGTNDCGIEGQFTAGRASMTAYIPPIPKFARNYYAIVHYDSQNTREGQRIYYRDGGDASRVERYSPDGVITTVIKSGRTSGWNVTLEETNGEKRCTCAGAPVFAENLFFISEGFQYKGSRWSYEDVSGPTLNVQILSDYEYVVPGMETQRHSVASACVINHAYPWDVYEEVYGIESKYRVSVYSEKTHDSKLFEKPCVC